MSDDDPFEELEEEIEDREGDPFDDLGYPGGDHEGSSTDERDGNDPEQDATAGDGDGTSPWGEPLDPDTTDERLGPASEAEPERDTAVEPKPDVDLGGGGESPDRFDGVGRRDGDPFEAMGDAFTKVDVEGVDPDEVWEQLSSAQSSGSVTERQSRTYAEVPKHSYCEQCEHFSEPPAVDCSHEGTEIVEFLDMETVRVVDCPVVAERKELEGE